MDFMPKKSSSFLFYIGVPFRRTDRSLRDLQRREGRVMRILTALQRYSLNYTFIMRDLKSIQIADILVIQVYFDL